MDADRSSSEPEPGTAKTRPGTPWWGGGDWERCNDGPTLADDESDRDRDGSDDDRADLGDWEVWSDRAADERRLAACGRDWCWAECEVVAGRRALLLGADVDMADDDSRSFLLRRPELPDRLDEEDEACDRCRDRPSLPLPDRTVVSPDAPRLASVFTASTNVGAIDINNGVCDVGAPSLRQSCTVKAPNVW